MNRNQKLAILGVGVIGAAYFLFGCEKELDLPAVEEKCAVVSTEGVEVTDADCKPKVEVPVPSVETK